jgi:hypothetical protein
MCTSSLAGLEATGRPADRPRHALSSRNLGRLSFGMAISIANTACDPTLHVRPHIAHVLSKPSQSQLRRLGTVIFAEFEYDLC